MRIFKVFSVVFFLVSLGSIAIPARAVDMPDAAKKNGCTACHTIDKKLVGPAWMDISKKYKGVKTMSATFTDGKVMKGPPKKVLVAKVKKGGKGNWVNVTGGVAMPVSPSKVSDADISKLVTFILGLAK